MCRLSLVLAGALAACVAPDETFDCKTHDSCSQPFPYVGACVPATHWCALWVADCPTEWRYVDAVPEQWQNACVPTEHNPPPPPMP